MKKYILTIENKKFELEVNVDDNVAEVLVNGKSYRVEIENTEEKSVKKIVRPIASKQSNQSQKPVVAPKQSDVTGEGVINSPLPGVVMDVLVSVGEHVKRGDILVILEAMKMENNIMAGHDGIVKTIFVNNNETVKLGDALVEVEEIKILN